MPTFSHSLEQSLHRALALANERNHEYATLEHLLLSLIDDQDAVAVMRACNVDIDQLKRNLSEYVDAELDNLITDGQEDSKPTAGFQRADVNASAGAAPPPSEAVVPGADANQSPSDAFVVNGSVSNGVERRAIGNARRGPGCRSQACG